MVQRPSDDALVSIYRSARTIAVVGASANPDKPAHFIPAYLRRQGYRIIPVNPTPGEILGEPAVASLADIADPVDIVNVFRPAPEAPDIAAQAAALGASTLWLQAGISSDAAAEIAGAGGLTVVMDTCIKATHERLSNAGLV